MWSSVASGCLVALFVAFLGGVGWWLKRTTERIERVTALVKWQAVALVIIARGASVELPELPEHVLDL